MSKAAKARGIALREALRIARRRLGLSAPEVPGRQAAEYPSGYADGAAAAQAEIVRRIEQLAEGTEA
jgi:hypothetical protein